jgi:hypothetical protein
VEILERHSGESATAPNGQPKDLGILRIRLLSAQLAGELERSHTTHAATMKVSQQSNSSLGVFYSWQSDLPERTNRRRIREALQAAAATIEDEFEPRQLKVVVDEATRGLSGSPNIPQAIIKKIRDSDVFVADITTINSSAAGGVRKVANPNVMFELGYAVARLGWERIILLFNEAYGAFPGDVAFDIDRHRASPYTIEETASKAQQKQQAAALKDLLVTALRSIVVNNPLRGEEDSQLSPEQRKRAHDLGVLRQLFGSIHLPTLDRQIEDGPQILPYPILQYHAGVASIVESSLFHVYDSALEKLIKRFYRAWTASVSHGAHYGFNRAATAFNFLRPPTGLSTDQREEWKLIVKELGVLKKARDALVRCVRAKYDEIDLAVLSASAHEALRRFENE